MHIFIFTGGDYPEPQRCISYLRKNGAPDYVIAADSGLDALERYTLFFNGTYNFSPRLIVGDMDSISDKSLLHKYSSASLKKFPCDKDWTDTEIALNEAYQIRMHDAVEERGRTTLVGGAGGRFDHLLAIYETFSEKDHADVWLQKEEAVYFIPAGAEVDIEGVSSQDNISIARISSNQSGGTFISHGLEWDGSHFRKRGMPSMSNRITKDFEASQKTVTVGSRDIECLAIVPIQAIVSVKGLTK